ncbi:MAG: hypothetical protein HYX39_06245 [Bacteroidetes bacterium]|nr:hypothetical protein [Bacteroidota bacterium]
MKTIKSLIAISVILLVLGSMCNAKAQGIFDDKEKKKDKKESHSGSFSGSSGSGYSYKTGIGLRGGFTSGLSVKHFIGSKSAIEGIIGSRWRGLSLAALYELHTAPIFGVSNLALEYGVGGRLGFYNGYYYRWDHEGDPYYQNRTVMTIGVIGIFGLEYKFDKIPFTLGVDLLPYFDFVGGGDSFIDGSLSFRYILK